MHTIHDPPAFDLDVRAGSCGRCVFRDGGLIPLRSSQKSRRAARAPRELSRATTCASGSGNLTLRSISNRLTHLQGGEALAIRSAPFMNLRPRATGLLPSRGARLPSGIFPLAHQHHTLRRNHSAGWNPCPVLWSAAAAVPALMGDRDLCPRTRSRPALPSVPPRPAAHLAVMPCACWPNRERSAYLGHRHR